VNSRLLTRLAAFGMLGTTGLACAQVTIVNPNASNAPAYAKAMKASLRQNLGPQSGSAGGGAFVRTPESGSSKTVAKFDANGNVTVSCLHEPGQSAAGANLVTNIAVGE
jgi:hypothetical protein